MLLRRPNLRARRRWPPLVVSVSPRFATVALFLLGMAFLEQCESHPVPVPAPTTWDCGTSLYDARYVTYTLYPRGGM